MINLSWFDFHLDYLNQKKLSPVVDHFFYVHLVTKHQQVLKDNVSSFQDETSSAQKKSFQESPKDTTCTSQKVPPPHDISLSFGTDMKHLFNAMVKRYLQKDVL